MLGLQIQAQNNVRLFLLTSWWDEVIIETANTRLQALVDGPGATVVQHCAHLGKVLSLT